MPYYPIDRDVPLLVMINQEEWKWKYPWANMAVGDSFFVPAAGDEQLSRTGERIARAGMKYAALTHHKGIEFSTRPELRPLKELDRNDFTSDQAYHDAEFLVLENDPCDYIGVRVWRTA